MNAFGRTPEIVANTNDRCGESPLWDWRRGLFSWVDINGRVVHHLNPMGGVVSTPTVPQPAGMALAAGGGLLIAGVDGIHLFRDGKTSLVMTDIMGHVAPFNDILATPGGRLYAGTQFWGDVAMERTGCLYLIDVARKSATIVDEGIELSNGLALSPDGKTLYYADSTARRIYAYDVNPADETLMRKRVFVAVPDDEGIPDGLTVDADGFVWSAQWYGGQVLRYDPDGKVQERIALPVKQVSSVGFGGEELDCLFITTAGEHWDSRYVPRGYSVTAGNIDGALFAMRPGVQGRKEYAVKV